MRKNKVKIKESAAAGATGAHSIAIRFDSNDKQTMLKRKINPAEVSFLKFFSGVKNKADFKPVKPYKISLNEDVSLDQMWSKLRGIEGEGRKRDDAVTYGVEDDEGNMMKITVQADQAEDFEVALAQELGEVESYKMTGRGGHGRDVSMAEVLFTLKNKFDIIDVEFPEIPKDMVYNADKVTKPEDIETDVESPEKPDTPELSDQDLEGDMENSPEEDEEDKTFDTDLEGPNEEDSEEDKDIGEEFEEDEEVEDEKSILQKIIKMLSAEAEARKAQHEAEAEKAKAKQAEYSMATAKQELMQQEDLLKMEEEKERQKEKEKEAKKLADLARYKLKGSVSEGISFKNVLTMLNEFDEFDSEVTIRRQMAMLPQKFAVDPNDSPDTANYKRTMQTLYRRLFNIQRQMARARDQERERKSEQEQQQQDDQTNNQQTNQQHQQTNVGGTQ